MAQSHATIPEAERHNPKGFDDESVDGTVCKNENGNLTWATVKTLDIEDLNVTNGKIANGDIGAEKLQTGTAEESWVRSRMAGSSAGDIGTLGFFDIRDKPNGELTQIGGSYFAVPGAVYTSNGLRWAGGDGGRITDPDGNSSIPASNPSGNWMCLGFAAKAASNEGDKVTLFMRVS